MKKLVLVAALLPLAALGCQQDMKKIEKQNEEISKKLDDLLAEMKKGGGMRPGAGQQQQRQPRPTADPTKTYSVNVEGAPFEGPADALVTVVKGYEYACPFCEKVRPTLAEIKQKYGKDVKIVAKQFVVHPQVATSTALAACAAHKQGKFHQMDEGIWEKVFKARKFDKDRCWQDGGGGAPAEAGGAPAAGGGCANVEALAKEIGLNVEKFKSDMKECMPLIQRDQKELAVVGLGATPGFFINGRFLSGAQPFEAFAALIDEELKKAKDRVGKGEATAATYYKTFVVEKGEKQAEVK